MLFVVNHNVRLQLKGFYKIDPFQVLRQITVEINEYIDTHLMPLKAGGHLKLCELPGDQIPVLIPVKGKVHAFQPDPLQYCQVLLIHQTDIQSLVKIHACPGSCHLLQELQMILACQDIRIAQDKILLTVPELPQIRHLMCPWPIGRLGFDMTEIAFSGASTREEAEGCVFCQLRIDGVVRIDMLDFIRQGLIPFSTVPLFSVFQFYTVARPPP